MRNPIGAASAAMFAAAATLATAVPAAAQFSNGVSVLSLLPVEATVGIGSETEGRLTDADYEYGGELVRAFGFDGARGAPLTIDVISDEFDAYLYLLGPDGRILDSDDDSGGACNARISTFLADAGRYTIIAASLTGGSGAFTLRADDQQHPPAEGDCGGDSIEDDMLAILGGVEPIGAIMTGDSIEGELVSGDPRLADGSYMKVYELAGTPGDRVVIDVVSRAFDALLLVVDPGGESYESDDDSGGACNPRLELTLDMQPHKLVVTSFGSDGAGPFTLSVSEEAGPTSSGPCPG